MLSWRRALLALYTTLCLLVSLLAIPAPPILVCRITSVPMSPRFVAPDAPTRSCCAVSHEARPGSAPRYTLVAPGCCELREAPSRPVLPAVPAMAQELPAAVLLDVPVVALPVMASALLLGESLYQSPSRAPPLIGSSPRAPPSFS